MSQFHSKEFKTLQKAWYQKLKSKGFDDIEDTNSPREYLKAWHSRYFFHQFTPETFEHQEAYYRLARDFYWTYAEFENELEREIWRLHAEGISRRKIKTELDLSFSDSLLQIKLSKLKKIMQTRNWPTQVRAKGPNDRGLGSKRKLRKIKPKQLILPFRLPTFHEKSSFKSVSPMRKISISFSRPG